jgi:uncharacterized membrane protein
MQFETTVSIDAAPAKVWAIMADIDRWSTWTKSVQTAVRGEPGPLQVGSTATVKQPKLAKSHWVVTEVEQERNFTWVSKAPGVTSVGSHRVDPTPAGGCVVTLTLDQGGPLAAIVGFVGGRLIRRYVGFEAAGLKARAEGPTTPEA